MSLQCHHLGPVHPAGVHGSLPPRIPMDHHSVPLEHVLHLAGHRAGPPGLRDTLHTDSTEGT